jgi:peptide-methionine (S)-S-oxide reductase
LKPWSLALAAVLVALVGWSFDSDGSASDRAPARLPEVPAGMETATFAGGCFWCMESPFEKLPGVLAVTSGYTGGDIVNPTYEQVSSGGTGHTEAVRVVFDPKKVSYGRLLEAYWPNVDPTVQNRQFCDVGEQYRTAIFVHGAAQRKAALASKAALEREKPFPQPILTPVVDAGPFYPAEEYHQDYESKNYLRYCTYRAGCGRDARLRELWGAKAPH